MQAIHVINHAADSESVIPDNDFSLEVSFAYGLDFSSGFVCGNRSDQQASIKEYPAITMAENVKYLSGMAVCIHRQFQTTPQNSKTSMTALFVFIFMALAPSPPD